MNPNLPIGIFDSGVGGLTVYRALHERLPTERYVYLGDTARVPYGTKSLSTVERYAIENARFLESRGMKLLVVACNTASALAIPAVRAAVGVPVVGMIGPGARAAVREAAAEVVESVIEKEDLRRTATQELRDLREAGARARFLCDDLDHFYVTDAAERFAHVAERFLGSAPRRLEAVEVWGHDELHTR